MIDTYDRFWSKTKAIGCSCIEWIAARDAKGYGQFWHSGRMHPAHRIAWEISFGLIPEGMCVLHQCDHPWCVNPDHLFLGTKADNNADMLRKGRQAYVPLFGEKNGAAKLTKDQVRGIRSISGLSQRKIAKRFGVSQRSIGLILRGEIWRHV